ncbi:kyphoscoliosis peptidase-like isoform X3 [Dreissena polymorpha]|nr:kyphoscoliosis peptidase-like isoform X3 [Dreissena polymorpha]XP_052276827.1 kyphoscoliosis peptidase-like isoform X3 [Dreissena polymorpha]XP_052276828.1 kyphoscoliosis peptidase-like isoform X3 [Dreissena polymorpha]
MMNAYNMDSTAPPILFHAACRRKEKEFWETVKTHLTYKGYYDKFPTPRLLREAMDEYRSIHLEPPLDATGKPLPYPAMTSKADIIDREAIETIDAHALGAPRVLAYEDMYKLVKYLTGECNNDVERLRAIFRWIASQNLKQWHDEVSFNRDSAAYYLARIRAKKANHNQLLQRMCSLANIYCVKIRGYVKGVDYGLGQELTECDSTWTAVLVDGAWRLLDVYWATCHRVHSGDSSWELIDDGQSDVSSLASMSSTPRGRLNISKTEYAYNDYYFLTDPEQFIYSHFPVDEKWQLLARPITLEEAKKMALLKRNFFSIGMDIVSHPRYIIECDAGEEQVTFSTPQDVKVNYKYELYVESDSDSAEELHNMSLDRYVFLEKVTKENLLNVKMRFPAAGKFKLKILAKEQEERSFYYTVTYIIDVLAPMENCRPLPKNERGEWGPGLDTQELGLEPITHDTGEVPAEDGKAEVRFGLTKPVEFKHKLVTGDDKELPHSVLQRVENQEAIFNIRVPEEGEYAFNLYAKEEGQSGEFPNVCSYLLKCEEEPEDKASFPDVGGDKLGPTDAFRQFGMQNISIMPALMLAPITGEVTLQFKLSRPAVFIPELLLHNNDGNKTDFSEYTMWDIVNGVATFYITIPRVGMYSLAIRAKPTVQSENFTPIFHSIIDAIIPKKQCLPCPQQSIDWPSDCHVVKPLTGVLAARELIHFEIEFPRAYELVATSGNGSKLLKKNAQGIWEGEVLSGNEDSVVTISVRHSDVDDSHYILTYKVIERDEIVGERLRQLDRYKDAVRRAEAFRDAGKLPKNFDWSKLEDIDEEDLEELAPKEWNNHVCRQLARLLRDQKRSLVPPEENVDDVVADCSGDEEGGASELEEPEVVREADMDVEHVEGNLSTMADDDMSDSDDEEIRKLMERKRNLELERERLKDAKERRKELREHRKMALKQEVDTLEHEVSEMSTAIKPSRYKRPT